MLLRVVGCILQKLTDVINLLHDLVIKDTTVNVVTAERNVTPAVFSIMVPTSNSVITLGVPPNTRGKLVSIMCSSSMTRIAINGVTPTPATIVNNINQWFFYLGTNTYIPINLNNVDLSLVKILVPTANSLLSVSYEIYQ